MLRDALVRLLATRRLEELTVRDVVDEAKLGYATFFRHYRDREALLDDIIAQFLARVNAATVALLAREQDELAALTLCRLIEGEAGVSRVLLTGGASETVARQFVDRAYEMALAHPSARPNAIPGRLALLHPLTAICGILAWWLRDAPATTSEEVARLIHRLVLKPVTEYEASGGA